MCELFNCLNAYIVIQDDFFVKMNISLHAQVPETVVTVVNIQWSSIFGTPFLLQYIYQTF